MHDLKERVSPPRDAVGDIPSQVERMRHALTVKELSGMLGQGKTVMYERVSAGRIPYYRIDGSIRFDPYLTAQWLRGKLVEAGEETKKAA